MDKQGSSDDTGTRPRGIKRTTDVTEESDDVKEPSTLQEVPNKKSRPEHGEESSSPSESAVSRKVTTSQQPDDSNQLTTVDDTGIEELDIVSANYEVPTDALTEAELLPVADRTRISEQWREENEDMSTDFSEFTRRKYVVNKSGIVGKLLHTFHPKKRNVFFFCMPTGCIKTTSSIVLEKFFSANVGDDEREKLLPWFTETIDVKYFQEHKNKYTVFRMSFSGLRLRRTSTMAEISSFIYRQFLKKLGGMRNHPLFKPANESVEFENYNPNNDNVDIFSKITWWLRNTFTLPVVVILDELDLPVSFSVIEKEYVKKVAGFFSAIMARLVCVGSFKFVIGFGIHPWYDVFSSKDWRYCLVSDREWASCFLFTQGDMDKLKTKYTISDADMAKIKAAYGGYGFDLYNPASVTRYLSNGGELKLYKWHRRTYDILDLDNYGVKCILSCFMSGKEWELTVDLASKMQGVSNYKAALAHYVSAGLLSLRIVPKDQSKKTPEKMYISAGNLENRNIIGFFLKRIVDVSNVSEAVTKAHTFLMEDRFEKLAEMVNDAFRNMDAKELVQERDYHNPLHFFFYLLIRDFWEVESEDCFCTGNKKTGQSGFSDLTLNLKKPLKLTVDSKFIIMELKVVPRKNQDITEDDITSTKKRAFQQIVAKGYAGDRSGKISEVAVVCSGKVVKMFLMTDADRAEAKRELTSK
ncbi:uncharacterized protein LOC135845615 [Planococcus citri]|uniref:uncharacterized protein LOC135845615 n=1 Tax=Planococcus citri TaxID=170843 RepID=UPI0031F789EC